MPCPLLPWLRLLAGLLVAAGGGASPQQPEPYQAVRGLTEVIGEAVTAATEPLLRPLTDMLERLDSQLNVLATRLDNQDHKLDGLTTKLDNRDHKLDGLITRLNNQDHKLNALSIRLENHNSELSNHNSKLEGLMVTLENQDFKMDGLAAKLSSQESKLDEIRNRLTASSLSQDSKLDGLVTTLYNQSAELNGLANSLSNQDSKLNGLVMQVYTNISTLMSLPRDCSELPAGSPSGIHLLRPGRDRCQPPVAAYCDLHNHGGRWTVIQRRADVQPRQDFNLGWDSYKAGFGELDAEFWWGLRHVHTMTSLPDRQYELRIDLEDFDDARRYAVYGSFRISSERDGYRLLVKNFTGDAGDSMLNSDGQMFSTIDKDQDSSLRNCAAARQGGWWHNMCGYSSLNGPHLLVASSPAERRVFWYHWRGDDYSLKAVDMKIRPI